MGNPKNIKARYLWMAPFMAGAGLGLGIILSYAFNGPPSGPPGAPGAIGVDTANNLSFGTSTPFASTKVLIVASSTSGTEYGLRIIQPSGAAVLTVRNDGNIGAGTLTPSYKFSVVGDINSTGVYRVSGAAGVSSISCPSGQALGPVTVAGGIVTSGGCTVVTGGPGGGVPSGSSGNVQFNSDGAFGGSNNLFWDNTNNRLGIGTAAPGQTLEVAGSVKITGAGIYNSAGYQLIQANATDWTRWNQGGGATNGNAMYQSLSLGSGGLTVGAWENQAAGVLKVVGSAYLATTGGNVGIGTASPGQKLDVIGGYIRSNTGFCIGASCITSWPSGSGAGNDTGVTCPAGQYLTSINITNGNVSGGNCSTPTYQ